MQNKRHANISPVILHLSGRDFHPTWSIQWLLVNWWFKPPYHWRISYIIFQSRHQEGSIYLSAWLSICTQIRFGVEVSRSLITKKLKFFRKITNQQRTKTSTPWIWSADFLKRNLFNGRDVLSMLRNWFIWQYSDHWRSHLYRKSRRYILNAKKKLLIKPTRRWNCNPIF